ncbi:MAG: uroporphyrinogen decarboxylase family protein [Spirochaetota bacterium]
MNARENVLKILKFNHPEYIVDDPPSYKLYYHGCNHEGYKEGGHDSPLGSKWRDIWGTEWHKKQEGVMAFPVNYPITEINMLKDFDWPDPNDERICGKIYKLYESYPGDDLFLWGSHRDPLWEKAHMLVGMENMMIYFKTEPEFVKELLHKIMDFQLGIAAHYLKVGVEIVRLAEDLGTQRGLLLSPEIIQNFLIPEYKRLLQVYREKDAIIIFHSCGHVEPVLEIFMQLGIDILNPVQATANNLERVREVTERRMALQGGVSSSTIMAGPVSRICEEVWERIWQLGQNGGYFCSPDQVLPFPEPHIKAFNEAVEKYGQYPLKKPEKYCYEK